MVDFDGLSLLCPDEGNGVVAVCIAVVSIPFCEFCSVERIRIHGNKGIHLVASVDAKGPACRSHSVCRINVSAGLLVVYVAPVVLIMVPEWIQVMNIRSFCVNDLAKKSLLSHVEGGEFKEVIHAVLQHHAVSLSLLCCVYQLPTVLDSCCCRHLDCNMLSMFHGIYSHRNMCIPSCNDIYKVYIISVAKLLPSLRPAVFCRTRLASIFENPLHSFEFFRVKVADGDSFRPVDISEPANGIRTSHS